MGIADRIFDGLRATIQLNERVSALGQELKALSVDVRDLDRRLIRVETALEIATSGRFAALRQRQRRDQRPSAVRQNRDRRAGPENTGRGA
jgi:hypothetical protein